MKKILSLLLVLTMVISLAACSKDTTDDPKETTATTKAGDTTDPVEKKVVTAQAQFDEAKASLEESIAGMEAALVEKYGSVEAAEAKLDELINSLGIKALDDKTLEVTLANPVPFFVDLMTFPSFFPASEKFYNEKGDSYGKSASDFLYNGPFILDEWKLSERHYLVKNQEYWNAAQVALDAVDYRVIEGFDNDTSVQMYLDTLIDSTLLTGENVEKYGNRPDAAGDDETVLFYLEVNFANGAITPEKEVLGHVDARKALNMAIDKTYITDVIYNNGSKPVDYFVPKGFIASGDHDNKGFREVAEDMFGGGKGYNGYDPEMAAELWQSALDATGYAKVELDCIIYQGDDAAKVGTHIKNELEKNLPGITVNILPLPFSEKLTRTNEGDFELNWGGWGPDYPDPMTWMDMWVTGSAYNRGGYSDEYYDAQITNAGSGELTAPDNKKERFEVFVELEKKLLEEDQVIIPLFQRSKASLRNPQISNWLLQSFGADYIWQWVDIDRDNKVLNLIEAENIPALVTWLATDAVSFEILGNINAGLFTLDADGVPVPDMVESYSVTPDGLVYTFKLKDTMWVDIDGNEYAPVTANDFVFAWRKLLDPAEAAQYNTMIKTAAISNGVEAVDLNISLVGLDSEKKNLEQLSVDDYEDIDGEE